MSDQNQYQQYGDYDEYGYDENNYDDNMQQQQQDYETKVQLEYFESQQMLRKGQSQQCLQNLQKLYQLSQEHNLRNWKPKILNLQLQIYCKSLQTQKILQTLHTISQLNQKQKYTQSSIKSIIMTIKSLNKSIFKQVKQKLYQFIERLDDMNKVRSWLMLVEKAIDDGEYVEGSKMVEKVNLIRKKLATSSVNNNNNSTATNIPSSLLIELYSHQITLSKHLHTNNITTTNHHQTLTSLINKIHLTLPQLQTESYLSDGHISIIKQSIAEIKYQQQNFIECSKLLCQAFQQQMKYGKDHKKKKTLLKINVLVSLLTEDKQLYMKDKHNALYHESAASFKSQNDIQSLYGVVQAFNNGDHVQFLQQMKTVNFQQSYQLVFNNVVQKVITLIKSNKLLQVIKPYISVKFSYLSRRLNCQLEQIEKIIYGLIMDGKIDGRIKKEHTQSYLIMNDNKDEYLTLQLENIKQLSKKFM